MCACVICEGMLDGLKIELLSVLISESFVSLCTGLVDRPPEG